MSSRGPALRIAAVTNEARRRAELATLIEKGWTNTPFSRCSYCGKDWNGGVGHEHGQGEMDPDPPYGFMLVHEDKGGTIKFDSEHAADAVLAYVADAVAQALREERERVLPVLQETERMVSLDHDAVTAQMDIARPPLVVVDRVHAAIWRIHDILRPVLAEALRREPK
jgi:hypothetical protein